MEAKAKELYEKVVTLDLGGRTGSYYDEDLKANVAYVEGAEFALGQTAAFGRKPDPAPLRAFIKKHPTSPLLKNAYSYLANYYGRQASKEDAAAFFDEYIAKFPDEKRALSAATSSASSGTRTPSTRASALAEKLIEMTGYPQNPDYQELSGPALRRSRKTRPRSTRRTARISPTITSRPRSSP